MPRNTLKKDLILRKPNIDKAFANVVKKISTEHFTFLLADIKQDRAMIAVIVAKKKVRLAIQRNRCRRIIKEGFRLHQQCLNKYAVVAIAKQPAAQATKENLWHSFDAFIGTCVS